MELTADGCGSIPDHSTRRVCRLVGIAKWVDRICGLCRPGFIDGEVPCTHPLQLCHGSQHEAIYAKRSISWRHSSTIVRHIGTFLAVGQPARSCAPKTAPARTETDDQIAAVAVPTFSNGSRSQDRYTTPSSRIVARASA